MNAYIHIPFCEQRCYYCAFTVAVTSEDSFEPYIRRLIREIELSGFVEECQTIYFGGGTPSLVPASMLERVLRVFRGNPAEITIEVNPGTLSGSKILQYRDAGITRISLGAQSLKDEDLRRAGRLHQAAAVLEDFEMLRRAGYRNINLDLIAGLPEQRFETWTANLDAVLDLRPEHISIYMLDVEERSAWSKHALVPADEDFAVFYTEAASRLGSSGYVQYEISNWALPGFECRHNLGYWTGALYRGFGVSAHSYDGARRFWNTASLVEYAARIDDGCLPISGEEALTPMMRLEEAFLLGLRQAVGFNPGKAAAALQLEYPPEWFSRVQRLQDAGWIEYDGETLKLTSAGRLIASSVTEELICLNPSSTFEAIR